MSQEILKVYLILFTRVNMSYELLLKYIFNTFDVLANIHKFPELEVKLTSFQYFHFKIEQ